MTHASIQASAKIEAAAPQLRTVDAMLEDMRNMPGPLTGPFPQRPARPVPPAVPADRHGVCRATPDLAQVDAAALVVGPNFPGASDVDGDDPPSLHGAIGLAHFVEVSNAHVDIFLRSNPAARTSLPLDVFFNVRRNFFDPRVVYDRTWNRWTLIADTQASVTRQLLFIAVSTSPNALGAWVVYELDISFRPGDHWFSPQPGMDQDAIIITGDISGSAGESKGAAAFAVAKARLYNGLGFSVPVFTGLRNGLTPPIVLDQNARTFLIAAMAYGGSSLGVYTLTNSSRPDATALAGPVDIPVAAYGPAPMAPQPGTDYELYASNCNFVSASTQTGNFLWQAHTINAAGQATPKFYQVDTAASTIVQSALFYATPTSYDFNVSIAANSDNDIFVTWSVTDPARGTYPQVRASGFDHNDGPVYVLRPGVAAFTSPTWKQFNAWGYCSAVTIDPRNPRRAWLVNEAVQPDHDWGSRIVAIGLGG